MITEEQFESTYRQLLQDLQDSYFTACRRAEENRYRGGEDMTDIPPPCQDCEQSPCSYIIASQCERLLEWQEGQQDE